MLNRCPTSSYDQVCQVVKKELGGAPEEVCIFVELFTKDVFIHDMGVKFNTCFPNLTALSYFCCSYFESYIELSVSLHRYLMSLTRSLLQVLPLRKFMLLELIRDKKLLWRFQTLTIAHPYLGSVWKTWLVFIWWKFGRWIFDIWYCILVPGTTSAHDRYCSRRLCHSGIDCEHFASPLSFIWLQVYMF